MSVCYLEPDDEITGAIARLRAVTDGEVVVVVPPGSRIATSRINFKLLGREANERRLNIVAVSDEPQVRALAISAGLPTYDTLAAAEQALASFREADRRLAERVARPTGEVPPPRPAGMPADVPSDTLVLPGALRAVRPVSDTSMMPVAAAATSVPAAARRPRRRRVGVAPLAVIGLLALLVAGVAYGAYTFLPTATVTITPATSELRPTPFSVTADPKVAVADVGSGVVPAEWVDVPLRVEGTFTASGLETRETRASGEVRFRSENTADQLLVPEGTIVSTADGVQFATTEPASVPRADFATSTPGTVDVPVRAVTAGPRGNVAEGAITELPGALAGQLISVRNQQPTDGGRRIEENTITAEDYDTALAGLTSQLDGALTTALADADTVPGGLTAFPDTAQMGAPTPDQPANALVGTVAPEFQLALDATGRVLAVNETLVDELAAERVRTVLAVDQHIVGDQVTSGRSGGQAAGETVVYEVAPLAVVYSSPSDAALVSLVRGKTIAEALQAVRQYGAVEIDVWPDFVDRLPDQPARISIDVTPPGSGS